MQTVLVDTENDLFIAQCMRKIFTFYLNSCFEGKMADLKKIEAYFPRPLSQKKQAPHPHTPFPTPLKKGKVETLQ